MIKIPQSTLSYIANIIVHQWPSVDRAEKFKVESSDSVIESLPSELEAGVWTTVAADGGFGSHIELKLEVEEHEVASYIFNDNRMSGPIYVKIGPLSGFKPLNESEYFAQANVKVKNSRLINLFLEGKLDKLDS